MDQDSRLRESESFHHIQIQSHQAEQAQERMNEHYAVEERQKNAAFDVDNQLKVQQLWEGERR